MILEEGIQNSEYRIQKANVSELQIETDMQVLAGRLTHRGSNTDGERSAAEYIRERFAQYTPHAEIDDFYSIDNPWLLFPAYYAEFTVVSLIATWWPRIALCYGGAVFLAYVAEFLGYEIMGRFAPHYETQNAIARFLAAKPARLLIAMAHYDTGKKGPLEHPRIMTRLHLLHTLLVLCMAAVLLSCAVQALGFHVDGSLRYDVVIRWSAATILLAAAAALFLNAAMAEYQRGANDNASGAAALLSLAERLAQCPIEDADVVLVATGSNRTWMSGVRHFLATQKPDRETTYIVNIDSVGDGELCYTTAEGMLHMQSCSTEMRKAAEALAVEYGVKPYVWRAASSDALLALARGYKAISLTAQTPNPTPPRPDTLARVDCAVIARAADFAEALLRRLLLHSPVA